MFKADPLLDKQCNMGVTLLRSCIEVTRWLFMITGCSWKWVRPFHIKSICRSIGTVIRYHLRWTMSAFGLLALATIISLLSASTCQGRKGRSTQVSSPPPPSPPPRPPPAAVVNLDGWGVTLPVNASYQLGGLATNIDPIPANFSLSPYFYFSKMNSSQQYLSQRLILMAPTNGAITKSATDPRCELRYRSSGFWNVTQRSGTLKATLSIDQLPYRTDLQTSGNIVSDFS